MSNKFEKNQLNFHYNREERLSMLPPGVIKSRQKQKGFFRNNKPFTIILINVIIICLMFFGFTIYSKIASNRSSNSDFNFLLNGYIFDNNMLITLKIEKKKDSKLLEDTLPFEAIITLSDNNDFYKKFFDNMPDNSNKEIVLRLQTPITNYELQKNSIIYANIKYNDKIINLKSKIKNEK